MEDYKVVWEILDEGKKVTDWISKEQAKSKYEALKKNSHCLWAELIYSPIDDDGVDDEQVIASFEREVIEVLSARFLCEAKELIKCQD